MGDVMEPVSLWLKYPTGTVSGSCGVVCAYQLYPLPNSFNTRANVILVCEVIEGIILELNLQQAHKARG